MTTEFEFTNSNCFDFLDEEEEDNEDNEDNDFIESKDDDIVELPKRMHRCSASEELCMLEQHRMRFALPTDYIFTQLFTALEAIIKKCGIEEKEKEKEEEEECDIEECEIIMANILKW